MQVVIGGGTGFLGTAIRRVLQQKGHEVTVISRRAGKGRITWDQLDRDGLPQCDAVVSLAGENILIPMKRWDDQYKKEVRDSRLKTTGALVKAITEAKNPPKVFLCSSAVGYYPVSDTEVYTEESPEKDTDFITRLCIDWEETSKLPSSHSHVRRVIVRTGIVLGQEGGAIKQMIWPFWLGVGGVVGSGKQFFPWIHVDDLAGIFVHAIENENVNGVLNGVAPQVITNYQFTKAMGAALWRPTIFPLPAFVVNAVFGYERATMLLVAQNVVPKRTLESGYQYKFENIDDALKDIVNK